MALVFTNPEALAAIRAKDGHTQATLARAAGVSQTGISRLEAGSVPIRPTTAKRLADALGVPISAFTQRTQPDQSAGVTAAAVDVRQSSAAEAGPVRPHPASVVGAAQGGAST